MKLKQSVGIAIAVFALLVLLFWMLGFLLDGQPASQFDQNEARQKAAQNGLFDPGAPPIIH
ncbi:MAG TPA: hypothetical protein VGM08_04150 [Candidatus Saccharimonadales bacterium]|jgi:hypothetical protein